MTYPEGGSRRGFAYVVFIALLLFPQLLSTVFYFFYRYTVHWFDTMLSTHFSFFDIAFFF